jgi:membrane-associated phospholipid phosphatase
MGIWHLILSSKIRYNVFNYLIKEVWRMELTAAANWLNNFFLSFDDAILDFMNKMADAAGGFFTPLAKFITLLGEKGLIMLLLAIGFMCFSKTRKMGVCMFGAVCCGALITNIILKDWVARPRPLEFPRFKAYWEAVGAPAEDGFSFPSGHVTAAAAGMTALCFVKGKKMIAPSAIVVTLMCISRNYLMAHFPSDVLFGAIIGVLSGVIAFLITRFIFTYAEDNDDFPFYNKFLNFNLPIKLPDADSVSSFINHIGRGKGKKSGGHAAKSSSRAAETSEGAPRRRSAAAAKAGEDRSSRRAKGGASDWNSRWEEYVSRSHAAAPEADEAVRNSGSRDAGSPAFEEKKTSPEARQPLWDDDMDADMKIAGSSYRAPEPAEETPSEGLDFDITAVDRAIGGPDFSFDELDDIDESFREEAAPRRSRSREKSSGFAGKKFGAGHSGYKGRHEK